MSEVCVDIGIAVDNIVENAETFTVRLEGSDQPRVVLQPDVGVVTILDDDG